MKQEPARLVGARSANQVEGWIDAAGLALDAADLAEIEAAIKATSAGAGPTMPPVGRKATPREH
jgi:aryl-alcohol dehydrogenase-like predicted oxidoreductase